MSVPSPDPAEHVLQLAALAWARLLNVPDAALTAAVVDGGRLLTSPPPAAGDHTEVVVLRLGVATVVAAPASVLEAAAGLDAEVLALESTLLRLTRDRAPRSSGEQVLLLLADVPEIVASDAVAVSEDPADVAAVQASCPADDVLAADLPATGGALALVPDDGAGHAVGAPLAAAGHAVHGGVLADVRVLVRTELRGRGLGAYAAAVAAERAYVEGLVPQARIPQADDAAQRLALSVGFRPVGSVTRVQLTTAG